MHVMRARTGEFLELFDGTGYQYSAEVAEIGRRNVVVRVVDKKLVDRELQQELTVAIPIPKSDRQKFLVEKLTEIGVHSLVFLNTARSSVKGNEKTVAKLERLVIEASKQCQRNRLMTVTGPISLERFVQTDCTRESSSDRFFASPSAKVRLK